MSLNEVHKGKHTSGPLAPDAAAQEEALRWSSTPAGDADTGEGKTEKGK